MIISLTTAIPMFDFVDFGAGRPNAVRHAFGPHPADQNRASLAFDGDYNPERWPEEVWAEDAEIMRIAGVNLATVGLFPGARLEPAEGRHEFGWPDRAPDLIATAGVRVDLATGTASPPPWFSASSVHLREASAEVTHAPGAVAGRMLDAAAIVRTVPGLPSTVAMIRTEIA